MSRDADNRKTVSIVLPLPLLEWLDAEAAARFTSRTAVVVQAVYEKMERDAVGSPKQKRK